MIRLFTVVLMVLLVVRHAVVLGDTGKYIYQEGKGQLLIDRGVQYHVGNVEGLSVEQVAAMDFDQVAENIPNLGFQDGSVWVRFSLTNQSANDNLLLMVEQPSIYLIELYVSADGLVRHVATMGERFPFSQRIYQDNPNYLFPIHIAKGSTVDLLFKVESADQLQLPVYIGTERDILERFALNSLLFGIYLGTIGIMVVYNLFIYLSVRDVNYLYYIAFIIFVGLTQAVLKGYAFQYLWPGSVWMAMHASIVVPVLSGITTGLFTKKFLQVRRYFPKHDRGINIFMLCYGVGLLVGLIGPQVVGIQIIQFCAMIGSIYLLFVAEQIRRKHDRAAYFYLVAFATFLVCVVVFVARNFNIAPYNTLTANILEFGSLVQVTLLSFALADKINIYRKEKEESQARAMLALQENQQLIRQQNIILEQKVDERTRELTESNESLQTALTHLKETQSQLVEAEKMASLGQLTAGVAHEINNPINFVTSNVAPLKRDVGMIWEAIDEIEKVGLSDLSVEEKKKQIASYKEELDIDYLKTEIDFLLKGMHEGASRTAEIVKSLRIFSRVDEDAIKYADINEGLESTLVILNSVVKDVVQVVKQYDDLPLIECYPGKLNQVFLNIITNAVYAINKKFSNKRGGVLMIKTSIDSTNVHVSIADNGIGMSDQVKGKIFEPFFTTKEVGEGTGLGMSIVYNTMKKHQGEIRIDSEEGEGTTFELIIPLKQQMQ